MGGPSQHVGFSPVRPSERRQMHKKTPSQLFMDSFHDDDPPPPAGYVSPSKTARKPTKPSLSAAAAFFEACTLPRRVAHGDGFRKSRNDEPGSELFPVWSSSVADLSCLGIGVAMYFRQLLVLAGLCFLYGLMTLPTAMYYASGDYSPSATANLTSEFSLSNLLLMGSAVCEDYSTVPLQSGGSALYATACSLSPRGGLLDLSALVVLVVGLVVTFVLQDREALALDGAKHTAKDFSLVVEDPSPDASDPDEWKDFFSQWGRVAYVTIAKSNGPLLKLLTQRRELQQHLERLHSEQDVAAAGAERSGVLPLLRTLGVWKDAGYYTDMLAYVEGAVRKAQEKDYPVCRVFVTFAKESSQRAALSALTTGLIPSLVDSSSSIAPPQRFRGTNVLRVGPAAEPSGVEWESLHLPLAYVLLRRVLSLAVTAGVVGLSYFAIMGSRSFSPAFAPIIISVINALLPYLMTALTSTEPFYSKGAREAALMLKLVVVRFMTTAVISYMSTPFSDTLGRSTLDAVQAVLVCDALLTPTIALLDVSGFIDRMILARFAPTQEAMNAKHMGTEWSLGERYTSMSKTVFVALFYAAVYPPGMFIAALCFVYTYIVDKYCLLRVWRQAPQVDASVAKRSRAFILFAALAHVMVTANWYASWAFDGAMETTVDAPAPRLNAKPKPPQLAYIPVDKAPTAVGGDGWLRLLQPQAEDWMPQEQQQLVAVYGLAAAVLLAAFVVAVFGKTVVGAVKRLFYGMKPSAAEPQEGAVWDTTAAVYFPKGVAASDPTVGPLLAARVLGELPDQHRPDLESFSFSKQNVATDVPAAYAGAFSTLKCYASGYTKAADPFSTPVGKVKAN